MNRSISAGQFWRWNADLSFLFQIGRLVLEVSVTSSLALR